jgi:hypothetical protein
LGSSAAINDLNGFRFHGVFLLRFGQFHIPILSETSGEWQAVYTTLVVEG